MISPWGEGGEKNQKLQRTTPVLSPNRNTSAGFDILGETLTVSTALISLLSRFRQTLNTKGNFDFPRAGGKIAI